MLGHVKLLRSRELRKWVAVVVVIQICLVIVYLSVTSPNAVDVTEKQTYLPSYDTSSRAIDHWPSNVTKIRHDVAINVIRTRHDVTVKDTTPLLRKTNEAVIQIRNNEITTSKRGRFNQENNSLSPAKAIPLNTFNDIDFIDDYELTDNTTGHPNNNRTYLKNNKTLEIVLNESLQKAKRKNIPHFYVTQRLDQSGLANTSIPRQRVLRFKHSLSQLEKLGKLSKSRLSDQSSTGLITQNKNIPSRSNSRDLSKSGRDYVLNNYDNQKGFPTDHKGSENNVRSNLEKPKQKSGGYISKIAKPTVSPRYSNKAYTPVARKSRDYFIQKYGSLHERRFRYSDTEHSIRPLEKGSFDFQKPVHSNRRVGSIPTRRSDVLLKHLDLHHTAQAPYSDKTDKPLSRYGKLNPIHKHSIKTPSPASSPNLHKGRSSQNLHKDFRRLSAGSDSKFSLAGRTDRARHNDRGWKYRTARYGNSTPKPETINRKSSATSNPRTEHSLAVEREIRKHYARRKASLSHRNLGLVSNNNKTSYNNRTVAVLIQPPKSESITLTDTENNYFRMHEGNDSACFILGTANRTDSLNGVMGCLCKLGWHGKHCSIPDSVIFSSMVKFLASAVARTRSSPRRIINALSFNMEYEMLEARLNELFDVVDVFIILESNYTQYGDAKPLTLFKQMSSGYLQKYHSKIVYLFLDHFPEGGREDGWIADRYWKTFIGKEGIKLIKHTRPDDIFLYTDADEIPSSETILFLKLHDGYPEPFGFSYRWSVFGFFWKQYDMTRVMTGCTVEMFEKIFENDAFELRTGNFQSGDGKILQAYIREGHNVVDWYFADNGGFCGWHCSWCLSPDRIQVKLKSAINADFPRWGDYPEKLDLNYISTRIKTGMWFDGSSTVGSLADRNLDPYYAPRYLLEQFDKYKHLLDINYAGRIGRG